MTSSLPTQFFNVQTLGEQRRFHQMEDLKNCRTCRSAELGSDHHFVVIVSRSHREVLRCDGDKVCDRETRQEFQVKIGGAVEHLLEQGDRPVEER